LHTCRRKSDGSEACRPKRSKNAVEVVAVERSHCPKCGSSRRSDYWGKMVQRCAGIRAGTPYRSIIRRRCRCLDCGQVRIDKEFRAILERIRWLRPPGVVAR